MRTERSVGARPCPGRLYGPTRRTRMASAAYDLPSASASSRTVALASNVKVPRLFHLPPFAVWLTRTVVAPPACVIVYRAWVLRLDAVVHHAKTSCVPGAWAPSTQVYVPAGPLANKEPGP